MVVLPIPQRGLPSWICTKRLLHSPMLSGPLHQGGCWKIFPALSYWMPLHPLWAWINLRSHCSHHNYLFHHSCCNWCDPDFSWVSAPSLFFRLICPQFSRVAQTWAGWWLRWIGNFYYSYNLVDSLIGYSVLRSPSLGILLCSAHIHLNTLFKVAKPWFVWVLQI